MSATDSPPAVPTIVDRYRAALGTALDTRSSLAGFCYSDPEVFDADLEHVLRPAWHPVARVDDLPEPGDYRTIELLREPLILARGTDGVLRVFSRLCRHRGHSIVEGCGNQQIFACPYHRWTYGLDGALRNAPFMNERADFNADELGLRELATASWQGFVLTSIDPATPFTDALSPLDHYVEDARLDEFVTAHVLEFDSPWNWKVMVDNFMESYHHLGPHTTNLHRTNPTKLTTSPDVEGPFSIIENPGVDGAQHFTVIQVFPTLLLTFTSDRTLAAWYEMSIRGHKELLLRIHILTTPELAAQPDLVTLMVDQISTIHIEDIDICRHVDAATSSTLAIPGPLSNYEPGLTRFQDHLHQQLSHQTEQTVEIT